MLVTLAGMDMLVIPELEKALLLIVVHSESLANVIDRKRKQPANAFSGISVQLDGITTFPSSSGLIAHSDETSGSSRNPINKESSSFILIEIFLQLLIDCLMFSINFIFFTIVRHL